MGRKIYNQPNRKIKSRDALKLIDTIITAHKNDITLNRHLTVNLEEICPDAPKKALKTILDNYRRFSWTRNFVPAHSYVFENNQGNNLHAHILLHIPPQQFRSWSHEIRRKLKETWLSSSTLKVKKTPKWFKLQSIQYGTKTNHQTLVSIFDQIKEVYASGKGDIRARVEKIIKSHEIKRYQDFQFRSITTLAEYLLKGAADETQGDVYGRRFSCSRNLIR